MRRILILRRCLIMENNNLLNEVQVNEVIDEGVQAVETI